MKFFISLETVQTIINYLATKPYSEVFQLIDILSRLESAEKMDENKK